MTVAVLRQQWARQAEERLKIGPGYSTTTSCSRCRTAAASTPNASAAHFYSCHVGDVQPCHESMASDAAENAASMTFGNGHDVGVVEHW